MITTLRRFARRSRIECRARVGLLEGAAALAAAFALTALAAACAGGSGSSGFDDGPASEPEAIDVAASRGVCVPFDEVVYCGSGVPFAFGEGEGEGSVEIDEPMTPLDCTDLPDEDACVVSLGFTPEGFPAGTAFRVAGAAGSTGPWTLSSDMPPPADGGAPDDRDVEVQVPAVGAGAPPAPLVAGVLVYLETVPSDLPAEAAALADFGADVVFVTHELSVAPPP